MNISQLCQQKKNGKKTILITCYDYTFAKIIDQTHIDGVLVGDSGAMVMHGHHDTTTASVDMISWHTQAVRRGITNKFILSDLPFLSYRLSLNKTMHAVQQLMQAGAHAVKLEGAIGNCKTIRYIVDSGVPVIGHIGLTPQFIHQLGGYKVQGKNNRSADNLLQQAKTLQDAGCSALVLECVPSELGQLITNSLQIPTIGIGAGPHTDGQILVLQDALGLTSDFKPKFAKSFANGFELFKQALDNYVNQVNTAVYPCVETESY